MLHFSSFSIASFPRVIVFRTLALFFSLLAVASSVAAQSLPGSGNTLSFNGSNSYISGSSNNRGITQQVTVEAWIKTISTDYQWVIGKYLNSLLEEKGFHLYIAGGTAGFNGRIGVGQYMSSGPSTTRIDDGKWHHLTGVCNFSTWQIFVDGVLENAGVYNANRSDLTTSTGLVIGCYDVQQGQFFNGEIDEVRVWRTARSQAEIRDNMCRKFVTAPADLVAYYRLDQASGTTAVDHGSVPTNGSLVNLGSNNWHLSGAPLGDVSAYSYQTAGPASSRVALVTISGDSAIAHSISASGQGVQLYAVNSAPAITPSGTGAGSYVGVFTIGGPFANRIYALRLRPSTGPSCRSAYIRPSNELGWTLSAPLSTTATSLVVPSALYRGEYILTPDIAAPVAITGDSLVCAGTRTQLSVVTAGSATYLWNTGATTATLPNLGPGTYSVTVSFSTGCTRVLRRTVRAIAVPTLTISGDSTLCPGSSITLTATATGASIYRWSTGATTPTLTVSLPGNYAVTATYGPSCTVTTRREMRLSAAAPPAFTLGADTTLCEGDQLLLQGPAGPALRYQWSDGSTNRRLLVQTSGRYTLKVLTACGEQNAARAVAVRSCLVVPNVVTANADHRNDYFAVQGLKGEGWALDVYNRWGRAVFQTANYHNEWGLDAAPGVYYVLLRRPATGYQFKGWLEVLR